MTRTARSIRRGIVSLYGMSTVVLFIFSFSCNSEPRAGRAGFDVQGMQYPLPQTYARFIRTNLISPESPPSAAPNGTQSPTQAIRKMLQKQQFDDALKATGNLIKANPKNADGYKLQGGAYAGKRDFVNARKSFEKALGLKPDDVETLAALGQLDFQENDIPGARRRYQTILTKDPNNVSAMILMAQIEYSAKNESGELGWLEKAKLANAEAPEPRIHLASYYIRAGKFDQALAELAEADQNAPNNPRVLDLMGQAQFASGQKSNAISTYNKVVSLTPDSPTAHYRLGMARISTNDIPGGTENLKRALELKPDYAEAVDALASLDIRGNRYDEALKRAKDLEKISPKSPAGFSLEGDVFVAQKRYADAVKAYETAFALQPNGSNLVRLHAAQVKANDKNAADARLQQWLKGHPDDEIVAYYLAEANVKEGHNKAAIEQYEQLVRKRPADMLALMRLVDLLRQEKDPRALEFAERAYKLRPDGPAMSDSLGSLLVEQGQVQRGLELIRYAVAQAPENSEFRYHLAVALAKSGDKANARKELEAVLQKDQQFIHRDAAQSLLKQL